MKEMITFSERLIGLMFKKLDGKAYLFKKCRSVHTCFMKESIDVLGLDTNMVVIEIKHMKPFRFCFFNSSVVHVLESKSTTYKIGEQIKP